MTRSVKDRSIHFRANHALVDAATARAAERGVSLADFIRNSIRTAVDAGPEAVHVHISAFPDEDSLTRLFKRPEVKAAIAKAAQLSSDHT